MKNFFLSILVVLSLVAAFQPAASLAASSGGAVGGVDKQLLDELDKTNVNGQFSSKDPREIAAQLVQGLLGFLGIVFLVLIVYAGFTWMTSAGDSEKIKSAQGTIKTAVFGLAIVLLAYAITVFVTGALLRATT